MTSPASPGPSASAPDRTTELRDLLAGRAGGWSSAQLLLTWTGPLDPWSQTEVRVRVRRPLGGVPAGVRVEDHHGELIGAVLVDADGEHRVEGDGHGAGAEWDWRATCDPLALGAGFAPLVGAVPPAERVRAVDALEVDDVAELDRIDRPTLEALVQDDGRLLRVSVDRASGVVVKVRVVGGPQHGEGLDARVEELDERYGDDVFTG